MKFQDPLWFLLLIPLAVWFFLRLKSSWNRRVTLPYSDLSLLKPWLKNPWKEERVIELMKAAGFILLVLALARPQSVTKAGEPPKPVLDLVLCLDTSMSMSALDFDPMNRLEAAKKAAEEFIRKRNLDRIGLVVFGGKAIMQCPLTLDHESLVELLRSISLNATQTDGTAVGTALSLASSRLAESEAKSKIIILLTDGRSNVGNIDPVTAAQAAADLGIKIYAIGTAVPGGGLVPVEDPVFGKRLVKMAEDLDESTLLEIARITKARYYRVTSGKKFKEIYNEIDSLEKTDVKAEMTANYRNLYLPFLIPALILFCSAFFLKATFWRTVP